MAVRFLSQAGVKYLSTTALKWYGDSSITYTYLITDISWDIYNLLTPELSWDILNKISESSSWNILNDFDNSISWDILLGFETESSWDLQGIKKFFPGVDAKANPIVVNFKAFLKRELNIKASKVYNFYNRTEKIYEFRALRHLKRK